MTDILLQNDAEIMISNGDFVFGESLLQNQTLILIAHQGDYKAFPEIGVGISDLLLSNQLLEYRHRIRSHFALDGLHVKSLDLHELDKLKIEAEYE